MNRISVDGIEIELTRKRVKNINLRVKAPDGKVCVSAPFFMPESSIRRFVLSKKDWITDAQKRAAASMPASFTRKDREALAARITELLPKWESITGLYADSWHIRNMTSRWGSCNILKKRMCFNLQLAARPNDCLEYVILHELAHLKEAGHGPKFKAILDFYMPDWRDVRKKLNGKG